MSEIIPNLSYEDYCKRPGVRASLLKTVHNQSLKHAKAQIDGLEDDTDDKDFGTAFHSLLLEGRYEFVVHPETYMSDEKKPTEKPWNWNAHVCQKWEKEQGGKTILNEKEAKTLEAMVAAAHDALSGLNLTGDCELSIFSEKEGLPVKARIDTLPHDKTSPIIDFKKCRSAEPKKFLRQCVELGYHLQCAWILDVLRWAGESRKEVWMVGIEDKEPYATCILKFQDVPISFLRVGRIHCKAAFARLREAYETNYWPDYGQSPAEYHAMPWMQEELDKTA